MEQRESKPPLPFSLFTNAMPENRPIKIVQTLNADRFPAGAQTLT